MHLIRRATCLALAVLALLAVTASAGAAAEPQAFTGRDTDGTAQYRLAPGATPTPVRTGSSPYRADYTATIGGRDRTFRLYVPAGLQGRRAPLVLALHALYSDRRKASATMRWERLADRDGFVVVYPQGVNASWNAGRCCGRARTDAVDDVAALVEVQRLVGYATPVDPRRRYAAGFSNGGMMALSLACARPDVVAAALVVAGAHTDPCRPHRPVPVMQVHGSDDEVVPYAGTAWSSFLSARVPSVRDTQSLWASVPGAPVGSVRVHRVVHGVHAWPQTSGTAGEPYDATGAGWQFLRGQVNRCTPAWRSLVRPFRRDACG